MLGFGLGKVRIGIRFKESKGIGLGRIGARVGNRVGDRWGWTSRG